MEVLPPPRRHHRVVPLVLIIGGLPMAIFGAFLLIANLLFHDEPPPDDSMLRLPDLTVVATDNAYPLIEKLHADVTTAEPGATEPRQDALVDQMLDDGTWDEAHAAKVLTIFTQAIVDFHAAAAKTRYQNPAAAHPSTWTPNDLPKSVSEVRFVGKLVAIDALKKVHAGDLAGGLSEATEVVKLGQLMESSQQTLVEWLVASSVKQIGLSAVRQIARQSPLTAKQAKSLIIQLEGYRGSLDSLVTAAKFEYVGSRSYRAQWQHLDSFLGLFNISVDVSTGAVTEGPVTWLTILDRMGVTKYYYWPNQSWRFMVESKEALVSVVQTDCATGNLEPPLPPARSRYDGWGRIIEPNAIGKMYADIGRIALTGIVPKRCNEDLALSATQAALAVRAYQHETGGAPASLDRLTPAYFDAVPLDPYDHQPLRYRADQHLLYSVGQKRVDRGGGPVVTDWQHQDNPTWSVAPVPD